MILWSTFLFSTLNKKISAFIRPVSSVYMCVLLIELTLFLFAIYISIIFCDSHKQAVEVNSRRKGVILLNTRKKAGKLAEIVRKYETKSTMKCCRSSIIVESEFSRFRHCERAI